MVGASAIGLYLPNAAGPLAEDSTSIGSDWTAKLVLEWEKSYDLIRSKQKTILRIPPVLSPAGGAYPTIALPIKFGLGAALGSGNQVRKKEKKNNFFLFADFACQSAPYGGGLCSFKDFQKRGFYYFFGLGFSLDS
jgi:NAD dependent epimerase/dehydratase family enzyme